jgi:N-acetylglucosaminyl-diphospho-decaprenol L-rhamnosyltransferase
LPSFDTKTQHPQVAVVIVSYDSDRVLGLCLEALRRQTRQPNLVVIVDNCSPDPDYLNAIPPDARFQLIRNRSNEGFCGGNNLGYILGREHKYVLFLNPDAFLREDFIAEAVSWMERSENSAVGCLTGTLIGFDVERSCSTSRIDSTGIFQTWYGRWYDRGRGDRWTPTMQAGAAEDVPAICGALMFCRTRALEEVIASRGEVFDSCFFMYKEDIDLSLQIRSNGWRLVYWPALLCHHVRGWQRREQMPARDKYLSARNELRVCLRRQRVIGLPYSLLKLGYVFIFEVGYEKLAGRLRRLRKVAPAAEAGVRTHQHEQDSSRPAQPRAKTIPYPGRHHAPVNPARFSDKTVQKVFLRQP